jgi:hypothetical protein
MSFVKKAVKKVFKKVVKVTKKVVKSKWFKIAAIVGLSLFTAGVAAGGFAAFANVSTVGGFFGAVGTTMGTGWTALVGGLTGAAVPGAGAAGAAAGAAPAATGGIGVAGTGIGVNVANATAAGMMPGAVASGGLSMGTAGLAAGASTIVPATTQAATQGWLGKAFAGILKPGIGGDMLRGGIMMGINGYFQAKEREREEYYRENRTVWGGKAFGGSADPTFDWLQPKRVYENKDQQKAAADQAAAIVQGDPGLLAPQTIEAGPAPLGAPGGMPGAVQEQPPGAAPQTAQPPPADPQAAPPPAQPQGRINPELLGV